MPSAPSLPEPDMTMLIARSRWSSARLRKNRSIATGRPRGRFAFVTLRKPSIIESSFDGEIR